MALFAILFLGGSTSSGSLDFVIDSRTDVEAAVDDEGRRDAALKILDAMTKRTVKHRQGSEKFIKRMRQELAAYDVAEAAIAGLWDERYAIEASHSSKMLDLRFRLREQLTRDEWTEVFAVEGGVRSGQ